VKQPKPVPPSLTHFAGAPVAALDLSLTATGHASSFMGVVCYRTLVVSKGMVGFRRLRYLRECIDSLVGKSPLVVMEGLSFMSKSGVAHEITGLAMIVRMMLWESGKTIVVVPPATLKKFTSGSGTAEKSMQLKSVYQRWGHDCSNDNEADAVALVHYGLQLIGTEKPQTEIQRECLTKCEVITNV
jgi:Holliday junction resolvasome RuvABC endonuclease subunit